MSGPTSRRRRATSRPPQSRPPPVPRAAGRTRAAETAAPSLSAPAIGVRLARNVGTALPIAVTTSARTAANDATRAFRATSCRRGMLAGAIDSAASTHHAVSTMAMTIVTIALNTLSAINCRVTRLPRAPSARRIAISLARATPRAIARLATLAQSSNSRQDIAAKTSRSSRRLVRAISSASGKSRMLQPALVSGCSASIPPASVCIRAEAPSIDIPAFIRPTTRRNRASRGGPFGKRAPGTTCACPTAPRRPPSASGTAKSSGMTPITRQSRPSIWKRSGQRAADRRRGSARGDGSARRPVRRWTPAAT